ncbi:MAG: DUF1501 domain-containing protein [Pirellulaceae bacterium]
MSIFPSECGHQSHQLHRRQMLQTTAGGLLFTTLAERLARAAESTSQRPKSLIVLWLQGGASQLDTFDPQPGSKIAAVAARKTSAKGIMLAEGLEQLADQMHRVVLVRSVMSREGDHERATYNAKTGFRPDPTLQHPAIGAVVCHQLHDQLDIPRHISILPGQWGARGGYLGEQFDAFRIGDPAEPVPDVRKQVSNKRFNSRLVDLREVEKSFRRGRLQQLDADKTLQKLTTQSAVKMMSSKQLSAFDVNSATVAERRQYGDTPFGRGCLAARRLVGAGVRCVEVTLNGWDTHTNNEESQRALVDQLDPAFAGLLRDLEHHQILDDTIVLCMGEFGRTPWYAGLGGRDHWPHGFSVCIAGGGANGGQVIGETSPDPSRDPEVARGQVVQPCSLADIHATVLHRLDIPYEEELQTPIGRPMVISKGTPLPGVF